MVFRFSNGSRKTKSKSTTPGTRSARIGPLWPIIDPQADELRVSNSCASSAHKTRNRPLSARVTSWASNGVSREQFDRTVVQMLERIVAARQTVEPSRPGLFLRYRDKWVTPGGQTLDLPVSGSNNQQFSFICRPLSSVWIAGALTRTDRFYGAKSNCRRNTLLDGRSRSLNLAMVTVTTVPIGDVTYLLRDGRFRRLSVADFSQDPLAGSPAHAGELQSWARDKASEDIVAQLVPVGLQVMKARMGGLKIQSEYPSEIVFAPCAANPPQVHNEIGFALRPDAFDACDH